jgi:ribosomal-protein-alanine N-acetyltransferase
LIEEKKLIGVIRIYNLDFAISVADVSYILNKNYTGKGYMTEALGIVIKVCHYDLHLRTVCCDCISPNIASINVMLRCGMMKENDDIHKARIKGKKFDLLRYKHEVVI